MITITISGPQGSGKSRTAKIIKSMLSKDYNVELWDEDGGEPAPFGDERVDYLIKTEQTEE